MEPNRPNSEEDFNDAADLLRRMSRGATPAPEDHSLEHADSLKSHPDDQALRDMDGMPRVGRDSDMARRMNRWTAIDDEEDSVESGEPAGNHLSSDAFGLGGDVSRSAIIHARDAPADDTATSYIDNPAAESMRQRFSRPCDPTSTPARSIFGGPLASPFTRP
jgi:hypothetical protein